MLQQVSGFAFINQVDQAHWYMFSIQYESSFTVSSCSSHDTYIKLFALYMFFFKDVHRALVTYHILQIFQLTSGF